MEYDAMSTYRVDVAELISAQIIQALEKEYDRVGKNAWNTIGVRERYL